MRKRTLILLPAIAFCLTMLTHWLFADIISPGIYSGYFFVDRWGQAVLNHGSHYTFVSETMAARLRKHKGVPIKLNVTKILQPMNPGAGMITEAEDPLIEKSPLMNLKIRIEAKNTSVVQGRGIKLTVSCKNASQEQISVWPGALRVFLVTNRPFPNKAIGYKDPKDMAYWYYQYVYHDFTHRRKLTVASRGDRIPWSAKEMATHGKNLTTKREPEKYGDSVLVFGSGAEFRGKLVIGKKLLPREYEVFIYLNSEFPCPMSNRIAFDVVEEEAKGHRDRLLPYPSYPTPPIRDANPLVREKRKFQVPARLIVIRSEGKIAVSVDMKSLNEIELEVGHKMVTGLKHQMFAVSQGQKKSLGSGLGGVRANIGTSYITREHYGIPQQGQNYVIEVKFVIFETDIPAQHMWSPGSGKYRELWSKTIRSDGI